MAVVNENSASDIDHRGANSSSFSYTVSGSDTHMVLYVATGSGVNNSDADVTGVTYNSVSTSELEEGVAPVNRQSLTAFGLVAPASGFNTVAVSLAAESDHATMLASYTGVDQTTPLGNTGFVSANITNPTITISSATGEVVSSCCASQSNNQLGGHETILQSGRKYNLPGDDDISLQEKAGETTTVSTWTGGADRESIAIAVALLPVAAGGALLPIQTWLNRSPHIRI